jgi:hypothetical protein
LYDGPQFEVDEKKFQLFNGNPQPWERALELYHNGELEDPESYKSSVGIYFLLPSTPECRLIAGFVGRVDFDGVYRASRILLSCMMRLIFLYQIYDAGRQKVMELRIPAGASLPDVPASGIDGVSIRKMVEYLTRLIFCRPLMTSASVF